MKLKVLFIVLSMLIVSTSSFAQVLHLYGGEENKVYLGSLNTNKHDKNSIWNAYGTYGSKYNDKSIWNAYGTYGSKYNEYSPWNKYSSSGPIVVDKKGNFYGYFTLNKHKAQRAKFKLALTLYEFHEFIMKDVSKWYDKIFK